MTTPAPSRAAQALRKAGIPTLPADMIERMQRGQEPTDEQEELAAKVIEQAGLELRRMAGVSLEDLRFAD